MPLSPPPLGLERSQREEQGQGDRGEVIDEILGVDDAAAESVHVLGDRQILEQRPEIRTGELGSPADNPERQEHGKGAEARDDLVFGQRRNQDAHRQEGAAGQKQSEIARQDRAPLDVREEGDESRVNERQGQEDHEEHPGGQKLPRQHLAVADRVCKQQLDGARLLLFGEEPHGQHRYKKQEHHGHVGEERAHHVVRDVQALPELRLHEGLHGSVAVIEENLADEPPRNEEEEGEHDIGDGRAEVQPHLLLEEGPPAHQAASTGADGSGASSPATTRRNTSSRLIPTWRSSRSSHPRLVTSLTSAPLTSRPRADSTTKAALPSRDCKGSTASTPGTARSASATSPCAARTRSSMRAVGKTWATSSDSVPRATIRPRLMMMTPSQTMETSGRMWVERITVCWPASERISARISAICFGSRPIVGSSRIRTSGSPSSA